MVEEEEEEEGFDEEGGGDHRSLALTLMVTEFSERGMVMMIGMQTERQRFLG